MNDHRDRLHIGIDASTLRVGVGAAIEYHDSGAIAPVGCSVVNARMSGTGYDVDELTSAVAAAFPTGGLEALLVAHVWAELPAVPRASGTLAALGAGRALQLAIVAVCRCSGVPTGQVELLRPAQWRSRAGVKRTIGDGADARRVTYADLTDAVGKRPVPAASSAKPEVYLAALRHGFDPDGSQDAADAALIAVAGAKTRQKGTTDG